MVAMVPYSIEELDSVSVVSGPLVCYLKSFHAASWL